MVSYHLLSSGGLLATLTRAFNDRTRNQTGILQVSYLISDGHKAGPLPASPIPLKETEG